jgi:hypothetical protein
LIRAKLTNIINKRNDNKVECKSTINESELLTNSLEFGNTVYKLHPNKKTKAKNVTIIKSIPVED